MDRFDELIDEWKEEVRPWMSSNPAALGCKPSKEIIKIGPDILPKIRELYREGVNPDSSSREDFNLQTIIYHGLSVIVQEISCGEFRIPEEMYGRVDMIAGYTIGWLDAKGCGGFKKQKKK